MNKLIKMFMCFVPVLAAALLIWGPGHSFLLSLIAETDKYYGLGKWILAFLVALIASGFCFYLARMSLRLYNSSTKL